MPGQKRKFPQFQRHFTSHSHPFYENSIAGYENSFLTLSFIVSTFEKLMVEWILKGNLLKTMGIEWHSLLYSFLSSDICCASASREHRQ